MVDKNVLFSKIPRVRYQTLLHYKAFKQAEYNRTMVANFRNVKGFHFLLEVTMGQYVVEGMGFGFGVEELVVPVFFARVEIREDREQEFGILHRTANRFANDGIPAALVRFRIKSLRPTALRIWSSQTQLSVATNEHRARVCGRGTAGVPPIVLGQTENLSQMTLPVAAQDVVVRSLTWARLEVDQLVDGLAEHIVVNLCIKRDIRKESWMSVFVLGNGFARQILELPRATCWRNTFCEGISEL